MIWIWIAAAVIISWLFCEKGISWYHYIWLLLPIEMYGVTIAGATLKPYMLFGICIIAGDLIRNKIVRVPASIVVVVFALILKSPWNDGMIFINSMRRPVLIVQQIRRTSH